MLRAAHLGRGLFICCTNESFRPRGVGQQLTEDIEIARDLNRNFILADGFQLLARQDNSIPLFLGYRARWTASTGAR